MLFNFKKCFILIQVEDYYAFLAKNRIFTKKLIFCQIKSINSLISHRNPSINIHIVQYYITQNKDIIIWRNDPYYLNLTLN